MRHKSLNARAVDAGYHNYNTYIRSEHWRTFRLAVLAKTPQCRICAIAGQVVHHLTYERLGSEVDSDVVVLCEDCHNRLHVIHREHKIPLLQFARAVKQLKDSGKRKRRRKGKTVPAVASTPVVIPAVDSHDLACLAPRVRKLMAAGYSVNWISRRYCWDKEQLRSLAVSIKAHG